MKPLKLLLIGLLVLFIVGIGFAIFSQDWKEVEKKVGLSEDAAKNPLLAAELLLKNYDKSVSRVTKTEEFLVNKNLILEQNSSFIVDEAALFEHPHFVNALSDWVKAGGHLVYVLSPRRGQLNLDDNPFVKVAGLSVVEKDGGFGRQRLLLPVYPNLEMEYNQSSLQLYLPYKYSFSDCPGVSYEKRRWNIKDKQFEEAKEGESEQLICEVGYYQGFVTFIPSIDIISNRGLLHLDHGAFLMWLIGKNDSLYYLPSLKASNWLLAFWQWSWQFFVSLVVLGLFILWFVGMRFGRARVPIQDSKVPFVRHVRATGQFLSSHGHSDVLQQALNTDIFTIVELRQPSVKHMTNAQQAETISELTGIEATQISDLLFSPLPEDSTERTKTINLYKQLREAL